MRGPGEGEGAERAEGCSRGFRKLAWYNEGTLFWVGYSKKGPWTKQREKGAAGLPSYPKPVASTASTLNPKP